MAAGIQMNCDLCNSQRVLEIGGMAFDWHQWTYMGREGDGYAPHIPNVCGGDYIDLSVCLNCGKVQGKFPVVRENLAEGVEDLDAAKHFWDNYGFMEGVAYYLGRMHPARLTDAMGRNIVGGGTAHTLNSSWNKEVECFFIDHDPDANWGHSCKYVLIDPGGNMRMCELTDSWPPHHSIERVKITK